MEKDIENLMRTIVNKRIEFFNKYLVLPNAIEINAHMYSLLVRHYALNSWMSNKLNEDRPKIYGMEVYLNMKINENEDINCYYIKGDEKYAI